MFCENCGREMKDREIFCPVCGMKVKSNDGEQKTIQKKGQRKRKKNKYRKINREVIVLLAVVLIVLTGALVFLFTLARRNDGGKKADIKKETNANTECITATENHTDTKCVTGTENNAEAKEETEQESDISRAYYEKLNELQQTYGIGEIARLTLNEEWTKGEWKGEYLRGVCFAKLEDFNADGQEELVTVYLNPENESYDADVTAITDYIIEVWKYQDSVCKKIYDLEVYQPHQGLMDEAVFFTNVEGVPYLVQGYDDVYYGFCGYGADGFQEMKTLENDWIEQTGCKIDGVRVSESEYQAEFEKWWRYCEAYQVVDFSNPFVNESDFSLESEKMAAAGSLQETLSVMEETLDYLRKMSGVEEIERDNDTEKETDYSRTVQPESDEYVETSEQSEVIQAETAIPQVNMSCISNIEATSELKEGNITHSAENICDGNVSVAWVEGISGQGLEESVRIDFDSTYGVDGMRFYAGYQKSSELYYKNSRPSEMEIKFSDGTSARCFLEDFYGEQVIEFPERKETSWIMLTIKGVYEGNKYEDTVISEVEFY